MTVKELTDKIVADLESSLGQSIPAVVNWFLRVLPVALANAFIGFFGRSNWIKDQMFVRTSGADSISVNGVSPAPLKEIGRAFGIGDPKLATTAELVITVTGTQDSGTLDVGSELTGPNNVTYTTIETVPIIIPEFTVKIRAIGDQSGGDGSGPIGNLDIGDEVNFTKAYAGIDRLAIVTEQTVTGAAEEAINVYRQRILDHFQKPPQGGAYSDYELWAEETPGIINAFPYCGDLPGTIEIYCEATVASSGNEDGIPTPAQLEDVENTVRLSEINIADRQALNIQDVTAYPITRNIFNVIVYGVDVDDEGAVQTQITESLEEYFAERQPFIHGLSILPRTDQVTRSEIEGIIYQIVNLAGGIFEKATVFYNGVPIELYLLGKGELVKADEVSFQ